MDTRLLDMFHDAADQDVLTVTNGVHVHFHGVVQEAVQQHRGIVGYLDRFVHVLGQLVLAVDDLHGAAAQHIGRPDHQRIADFPRQFHGLIRGAGQAVGRLLNTQLLDQTLEALAVLGQIDGIRRGADDGRPFGFQIAGQLQRRLAAVLDDQPLGVFLVDDLQYVFQSQWLEVQAIRGIVVRGNRLGIAVDHDGLVAVFAHGERRHAHSNSRTRYPGRYGWDHRPSTMILRRSEGSDSHSSS